VFSLKNNFFFGKPEKGVYICRSFKKLFIMKRIVVVIVLAFLTLGLRAQSIERWVIGAAGGTWYNGTNFEIDYTVGELAVTTISNTNNTLTQGFQQPKEPLSWVSVQEYSDNPAQIILYPNPVVDQLNISIQNAQTGKYRVMVFDMLGQLLADETTSAGFDGTARLNMGFEPYPTGNYFVRILHEQKIIQTGKIVKVN
jgi:hypothetical protein